LKELVRYIHLNPLRAGIVTDMNKLDMHPWCGHSVIMNKAAHPWQNVDYVHGLFSDQKQVARKRYRAFVEKGIAEGKRSDLTGGGLLRSVGGWTALKDYRSAGIRVKGDERVFGDSDFVIHVLKAAVGMTTVGISVRLGICQSAVSRLSKRGEAVARELGVELFEKKA
jgi:putative transposase